ncbi:MAG: hypothetical protein XU10_C0010G0004 [Chloroflexi bacterium CSP1-4]|nr:MAG: hypothetical protein XU10_C0010G0004 [Chloroflexi bacterium CSP1-4]
MPTLFPILLLTHIALAVGLFLPSLLLPFALRAQAPGDEAGGPARGLLWLQAHGTVGFGIGLALTGVALAVALGPALFGQPWLIAALGVYAANLAVAFFVQRPNLRRLLGARTPMSDGDRAAWNARARRQRYVSYAMATAVGVIGFLMSTKPALW